MIEELKTEGLSKEKYKEIKFHNLPGSRTLSNTLFVLSQSDLPIISTIPIEDEVVQKYSLKKTSKSHELYTSVIDLNNTTEEVLKENRHKKEENEIRKSVLLSIILAVEIIWKKHVSLVQFTEYSEFRQQGLLNKLSDIEVIKSKNPTGNNE